MVDMEKIRSKIQTIEGNSAKLNQLAKLRKKGCRP